jgi:hypothetical protein
VRGASALAKLLHDHPSPSLRLFVVWEPVLQIDHAPPAAPPPEFADERAELFWDPSKLVSQALTASGPRDPGYGLAPNGTIWDTLVVFAPGARWDGALPPHARAGSDVIDAVPIMAPDLP